MISERDIEQVLNRADIVDVVERCGVHLGRGNKACCPFHNEKTPSFHVNPRTQTWHCFGGCPQGDNGGDAISFVMPYCRAIEETRSTRTAEEVAAQHKKESMLAVNQWAAKFYAEAITADNDKAKFALSYAIDKRGWGAEYVGENGIGFADGRRDSLYQAAKKEAQPIDLMLELGLLRRDEHGEIYDFYRDRLMIPIRDRFRRVIGFTARALGESKAKYINSPTSVVYEKKETIFGIDNAITLGRREDIFYLVEGAPDVIKLQAIGVANTVASLGGAWSVAHFELLKRHASRVCFIPDADPPKSNEKLGPGHKFVCANGKIALAAGLGVTVKEVPPGFSTDYISSNRLFTDADDFSMSIELPLDGANRRIFGAIDRDDVAHGRCVLDADLIDGHVHKPGAITVNTITEKTAKIQFLAGRSYQNFYPQFDDVKPNSLELGSWPDYSPSDITPTEALEGDVIALPWMSESDGVLQNSITNLGEWDSELDALSWQIRLFTLTERICTAVGYTLHADAWKNNREHYDLFCFNVVPADWNVRQWAALLPAWSLNEFFSFLELTLFAEIDVDHRARSVHFTYNRTILASLQTRHLEDIVDSHSVTISTKDESGYLLQKNRAYETGSNSLWNFMSCDWFFNTHPTTEVRRYPTLTALCADADSLTAWSTHSPSRVFKGLLYAEDVRTWFCVAKVAAVPLTAAGADEPIYAPLYELRPLNRFGNNIQTDDEDNTESTKIIPVALGYAFTGSTTDDFALRGRVALIDCGSQPDDATRLLLRVLTPRISLRSFLALQAK